MNIATIVVWLMFVSDSGYSSYEANEHFPTEQACVTAADWLHQKSKEKSGVATMTGVCVQATIIKTKDDL